MDTVMDTLYVGINSPHLHLAYEIVAQQPNRSIPIFLLQHSASATMARGTGPIRCVYCFDKRLIAAFEWSTRGPRALPRWLRNFWYEASALVRSPLSSCNWARM